MMKRYLSVAATLTCIQATLAYAQQERSPLDGQSHSVAKPSAESLTHRAAWQETDPLIEQAKKAFAASYSDICDMLDEEPTPVETSISFHYTHDSRETPKREAQLLEFPCSSDTYNPSKVYYVTDFANGSGSLVVAPFSLPELEVRRENDDIESRLKSVAISGYVAVTQLPNAEYNVETQSIESTDLWRNTGDASSIGKWIFRDGNFMLVKYQVDASFDGEVNYELLLGFDLKP